jgi:hypothetical protein
MSFCLRGDADSEPVEGVMLEGSRARQHDDGGGVAKADEVAVWLARSCNKLRKLCTGWPSEVRLWAALVCAAGETLAAATGEYLAAAAAGRS